MLKKQLKQLVLIYISDSTEGIMRIKKGQSFSYLLQEKIN